MITHGRKEKARQAATAGGMAKSRWSFTSQPSLVQSILHAHLCVDNQYSSSEGDRTALTAPHYRQGKAVIQASLAIGAPGDRYEREADAVAERVVRQLTMPSSAFPWLRHPEIPLPASDIAGDEPQPWLKKDSAAGHAATSGITSSVPALLQQSRGGGNSMDPATLEQMSGAFQTDFSRVRIHTDQRSVRMNRQLNARAFTHGNNIYFNRNQYQPHNTEGKRLLAHELTHVVQQGAAASIVQRTGQAGRQSGHVYSVEETIRLLDIAFSLVPRALADASIPQARKDRIRLLSTRLRSVYSQLERARSTDGSGVVPTFDMDPRANEIGAGDAGKSVPELYYPFSVSAPPVQQAAPELQAKFFDGGPAISRIPGGQAMVQRLACGGICIGIIILGGLLLSGCSRTSSGQMDAARLQQAERNFDGNNSHLSATELAKIHTALGSAVGNNTHLLVAYYDYYSNREITKASGDLARAWQSSGHYADTEPNSDTVVNPTILEASFPDNRLGALLIHEYVHTKHHTNFMGMYDYEEGEAYGVEYFLAERNGDQERVRDILGLMQNPSRIAMPALHGAVRRNFCNYYGAMKGLYQVIDTGSSSYAGSPFSQLTRDRARSLSAELVATRAEDFSQDLNTILTWVSSNRSAIGQPITSCN